jgi:molybdate transport system substrate-binding protein
MKNDPILIVGGAGKTGGRVEARLRQRGLATRLASRSTPIPFDWAAPAGWAVALEDAAKAYVTYHPDVSLPSAADDIVSRARAHLAGGADRILIDTAGGLQKRIESGEAFDVAIITPAIVDGLAASGKIVPNSRVNLATVSIGVVVKEGAPKPDISSPESFKQTLIAARTVSYSRGASGLQFLEAVAQLGIADIVKQKSVPPEPGELVGAVVARGAAEIGIQQVSELLPVRGIDIVGPLPHQLQKEIVYGASALRGSKAPEAAKVFASFLQSATAASVLKKHGLDPF